MRYKGLAHRYRRLLRFATVGLLSTAFYFLLLLALRPFFQSTALLAATCYGTAMLFNYTVQSLWTFKVRQLSGQSAFRYICMQGCAMIVNSAAMALLVDVLGLMLVPSQLLVTACVTVGIYALSANWVYR